MGTFLNSSKTFPTETQELDNHTSATLNGDNRIPPITVKTPQIERRLVTDEQSKNYHLPLSSTLVVDVKKMLYLHLDFKNRLTKDTLVDSRAYVIATLQVALDGVKK